MRGEVLMSHHGLPTRRRIAFGLPALGLAASLGLTSRSASAAERVVLKAGDQKGGLRSLLEAADELRNLSYDVEWAEFPAASPLAEALNAEAIDFGPIGDAPLLFALANGLRAKAFAVNRSDPYGTAVLVRPDSPLKTAADLQGRSIGTNRGSIGHFIALKALASAGLKPTPDTFRFLPPAEAKLALTQGAIDAWATWEPYTAMAETAHQARVLVSGRGLWSGLSYLAATDTALANKRPALVDLAQRLVRAQAWSRGHVADYGATLARVIGIPPDAARLQFERRDQRWIPIDAQVVADQQQTADFFLGAGLLRQRFEARAGFDAVSVHA
jgi:sulfonate transport system substrate-binding protein